MKKTSTILFLFFILLAATPAENFISELQEKFKNYSQKYPSVTVNLFFNQRKFSAGDTAYFKAHFVNSDFSPIKGKEILTLEIQDQSGKAIQREYFGTLDGAGNNQIAIDENIPAGYYTFVAYSEYMKNFSSSLFFKQDFVIAGRKQLAAKSITREDSTAVFAEGGHLVGGVPNSMVIVSSCLGTGKITDESGETVSSFEVTKQGTAKFNFTPKLGVSYYSEVQGCKRNSIGKADTGIAMNVSSTSGLGPVDVNLFSSLGSIKQDLYLVVTAGNKIIFNSPLKADDREMKVQIPAVSTSGLNQIFIFNEKGNVLAERVIYRTAENVRASIASTQNTYGPRKKADVAVSLTDQADNPVQGEFAVTVISEKLFPAERSSSFKTEVELFADLPAMKQSFQASSLDEAEWLQGLDNLLITQKWQKLNWADVLSNEKKQREYDFRNSLHLKGVAYFKESGKPVPDSTLVMTYLHNNMTGYSDYTSKGGNFNIDFLFDFWGADKLFYILDFKNRFLKESYAIRVENIDSLAIPKESPVTEVNDAYGEYSFQKKLVDKSYSFFALGEKVATESLFDPNAEFEDEMMGADLTVKVDDYVVFPTMAELIREIIPTMQHRVVNGKPTVRIIVMENTKPTIPKGEPLYIIDGVFTKNTDFFLNLKTSEILVIKLIYDANKLFRFGVLGKNGIAMVQTKKSIVDEVVKSSTVLKFDGLSRPTKFSGPEYSGNNTNRTPDLRSTLLWNPSVVLDAKGTSSTSFYTSDNTGDFRIRIQGFTKDRIPFSAEKVIKIQMH